MRSDQPRTQEAWTRVSLDVMAKTAEPALEVLYPQFYLEGTDNHTPTCSASSDA
jgi:hypothetical protein